MDDPTQRAVDNPCAICRFAAGWTVIRDPAEELSNVKAKAIQNMVSISENFREDGLHNHIKEQETIAVHNKCRYKYIRDKPGVDVETR